MKFDCFYRIKRSYLTFLRFIMGGTTYIELESAELLS